MKVEGYELPPLRARKGGFPREELVSERLVSPGLQATDFILGIAGEGNAS